MKNYRIETFIHPISNQEETLIFCDNEDGSTSSIPTDPANTDYQEYLKSLEETA